MLNNVTLLSMLVLPVQHFLHLHPARLCISSFSPFQFNWGFGVVITFWRGKWPETHSLLIFVFHSAEVLLQCHGGRAKGLPQVPASTQTQAPTTCHDENGGGHQHAHLKRPQTARERDHGLNWESQPYFQPLSCSEEMCKGIGGKSGGKW